MTNRIEVASNFNLSRATRWVRFRKRKNSPVQRKNEQRKAEEPRAQIYRPVRAICDIPAAARSKKRSVGRHPPLRLETSLRRFRVATTRSPGFPLDFLRYPIDFPSEEREKGGGAEESTQTAPIRKLPLPFSLSLAGGEEGREKNWVSTRSAGWTRTICTRKPFYGGDTMAGR